MMSSLTSPLRKIFFSRCSSPQLNIVYEDENLLLVDKRPGMVRPR